MKPRLYFLTLTKIIKIFTYRQTTDLKTNMPTSGLNMGEFTFDCQHRDFRIFLREWMKPIEGENFSVPLITEYHLVVTAFFTLKNNPTVLSSVLFHTE